jgi:hypothetical protein
MKEMFERYSNHHHHHHENNIFIAVIKLATDFWGHAVT